MKIQLTRSVRRLRLCISHKLLVHESYWVARFGTSNYIILLRLVICFIKCDPFGSEENTDSISGHILFETLQSRVRDWILILKQANTWHKELEITGWEEKGKIWVDKISLGRKINGEKRVKNSILWEIWNKWTVNNYLWMKLMSESIFEEETGGEKRRKNQSGYWEGTIGKTEDTWVTEGQRGKPLTEQGMFMMPNVAERLHGLIGYCSGWRWVPLRPCWDWSPPPPSCWESLLWWPWAKPFVRNHLPHPG